MILVSHSDHSLQEELPSAFAPQPADTRTRILSGVLVAGLHLLLLVAALTWSVKTLPLVSHDTAFTIDFVQTRPQVPEHITIPLHMIAPTPAISIAPPAMTIASAGLTTTPQSAAPAKAGGDGTSATGVAGGGGASNALPDATGVNDGGYLEKLRQHIFSFSTDPHVEGTVVLRFSIDKQGKVLSYEIAKTSGNWLVDEEALQMLRRAQPLPPIPDLLNVPGLRVTMPLKFKR